MNLSWTETKVTSAADQVSRLSEFLALDEFEPKALRYLTDTHISKFLKAIDEEEATQIVRLIGEPKVTETTPSAQGFEILDWLRVVGPVYEWERRDLSVSSNGGTGARLIIRLAELQPEWIGNWWRWRCRSGRALKVRVATNETHVIETLSANDFKKTEAQLPDSAVAAITARKPHFASFVPLGRSGSIASCALDRNLSFGGLVELLSENGIPSDAAAVIDRVLKLEKEDDAISRLNELVSKWKGVPASDPVSVAMSKGHERLYALMRSRWKETDRPSGNKNGDKLWDDSLGWRIGEALEAAACAAPNRFRLELGFSIGVRLANREVEVSTNRVEEEFRQLSFVPTQEMLDVLLPMAKLWSSSNAC